MLGRTKDPKVVEKDRYYNGREYVKWLGMRYVSRIWGVRFGGLGSTKASSQGKFDLENVKGRIKELQRV